MNVLLIGNGGREHALADRLVASASLTRLFVAPGNPGTAKIATNIALKVTDHAAVVGACREHKIDLVVIGPEDPLADGLTDTLVAAGVKVFGPSKSAARLESDKQFAKELMKQQLIPTADSRAFTDANAAKEYVKLRDEPLVIKAAGLAKGKGVTVCHRTEDALEAIDRVMVKREFGEAGAKILVEEVLSGPEVSVLAMTDGNTLFVMDAVQDHKAAEDGDTGPMTGGMGAYCPTPVITAEMMEMVEKDVLVPLLDGLKRMEIGYCGIIFVGLMLTPGGPKVLEFNCRFGDPETQALMIRLKGDLAAAMLATAEGRLGDASVLTFDARPSVCVVATSKGYPGKYEVGYPISGLEKAEALADVKVYYAGTKQEGKRVVTDGGRVLGVTAMGDTYQEAKDRAYEALGLISYQGLQARKDIAHQAIRRLG